MADAQIGLRIILSDAASAGLSSLGLRMFGLRGAAYELASVWSDLSPATRALGITAGIASGLFIGLAGAFKYAIDQAALLQDTMANIQVAVDGATANYGALQDTLINVSDTSIYSTQQVGEAFVALGQRGQDATAIINGVGQAATYLAEATRSDTVPAANLLGQTLQVFNMSAEQAGQAANDLAFIFEHGIPSVSQIQSALAQVAPVANQLGVSLNDLAPVLSLLSEDMGSGAKAGTALRYMLSSLQDPTSKAIKELGALGVITVNNTAPALRELEAAANASGNAGATLVSSYDGTIGALSKMFTAAQKINGLHTDQTFYQWATANGLLNDSLYNSKGQFIGLQQTIDLIGQKLDKLNPQQKSAALQQLFNVRGNQAMGNFASDIGTTDNKLRTLNATLNGYSAEKNAEIKTNTLSGAVNRLKTNFQNAAAAIGNSSLGPLMSIADHLSNMLAGLHVGGQLSGIAGTFLQIGLAATGLTAALSGTYFGFQVLQTPKVQAGLKGLATDFGALLSPIGALSRGGSNLATSFVTGIIPSAKNIGAALMHPKVIFDSLRNTFLSLKLNGALMFTILKQGMSNWLNGTVDVVKFIPMLAGFAGAILPILGIVLLVAGAVAIGVLMFTRFRFALNDIANVFKAAFAPAVKLVMGTFQKNVQDIQKQWNQMAPQINHAMGQLINALKGAAPFFGFIAKVIGVAIGLIISIVGGLVKGFIAALPAIIGVFTGIFNVIKHVTDLVSAIFHGQWGKIPGIIGNIVGDILGSFGHLKDAVLALLGGLIGNILGFFHGLWDKLVGHSIIPDTINAIISWFIKLVTDGPKHFLDLVGKIMNAVGDLPSKMGKLGLQILDGLANSITNNIGRVLGAIGGLGNKVIGKLKDIFHVASPSKVMEEIGGFLSQGLVIGITGVDVATAAANHYSKLVPASQNALANRQATLNSSAVNALRAGQTQGGGNTTHVHIQVGSKEVGELVVDHLTGQLKMNGMSRWKR